MKKILYITNIEVPYKVSFFNELAKQCNLTVLYERKKSNNRDSKWTKSEIKNFHAEYLNGIKISNEYAFSFKILKFLNKTWDAIFISCYNSPIQILAIMILRLKKIPYIISFDGEIFIHKGIKSTLKKYILKGASKYMVAGKESYKSLAQIIGNNKAIYPYYFSSMREDELIKKNSKVSRENFILVIGQYYNYKGMDLAFQVACKDHSIKYKFIGMGKRTHLFYKRFGEMPDNIDIIPFLQKEDLEEEYKKCAMLLLPTRQECWGLVVNEAASFGTPIVSTWGSGAAVEFLAEKYPQYLAIPNNTESLYFCIKTCLHAKDNELYGKYLVQKARMYNIERMVKEHIKAIM
mgnify:CR=1 FL=1